MKAYITLNKDNTIRKFVEITETHSVEAPEEFFYELDKDYKDVVPFKFKLEKTEDEGIYKLVELEEFSPLKKEREEKIAKKREELSRQLSLKNQLSTLEEWFVKYVEQVSQYERAKRLDLDIVLHIGSKVYETLRELDEEAKINAEKISEIRVELQEENV